MSFNFKVIAKDGQLTVEDSGGLMHVPDGYFSISGHEDAVTTSLAASRINAAGATVVQCSGAAHRTPAAPAEGE